MSFIFKIGTNNFLKKSNKYEIWSIYVRIYSVNELLFTKICPKAFSWIYYEATNRRRIPSKNGNCSRKSSKSATCLKAVEG